MISSLMFLVGVLGADPVIQGPEKPKVIEIVPKRIYTPKGFDSNDVVQFVIEGDFKTPCYRIAKVRADADEEKIVFRVLAYQYPGVCTQSLTPYLQHIDVDVLDEGVYPVWNAAKKDRPMGNISVHRTESQKRDDFEYANINSSVVFFDVALQRSVLMVFGSTGNSCSRINRETMTIRQTDKDLVEVLPILTRIESDDCKTGEFPLRERFVIPEAIPAGKYLFYFRTANGQSFYKTDWIQQSEDSEK